MTMYEGVRFDPRSRRGHVESYFLKINDPKQERALWVKATILARNFGAPVAESWAIAFERGKPPVAAKETVPLSFARFSADEADAELPSLSLSSAKAKGKMRDLAFDLALEDRSAPFYQVPIARMYDNRVSTFKVVSLMPDLRARGEVRVGDRTWNVDGWRGLLGHNWGQHHTWAYAWGHCNVWDQDIDLVFEGNTGRSRIGPVLLPSTLAFVRYGGETHALNHFTELFRNRGSMTFRRWKFAASGPTLSLKGEVWAETEDMVGLHYENPDGAMTYCLNSKLASARIAIEPRGGLPFVVSSRACALEIGTRDPRHGVKMAV